MLNKQCDLKEVFLKIKDKEKNIVDVSDGEDFENQISSILNSCGFRYIYKEDFPSDLIAKMKNEITLTDGFIKLSQLSVDESIQEQLEGTYIEQPFGSQDFPDFLLFYKNFIIYLEVKFTKDQKKPMWNSNIPKPYGLYILGLKKSKTVTFFLGNNVINNRLYEELHEFHQKISEEVDLFNEKILSDVDNSFGFCYYGRKAFDQKKYNEDVITDFSDKEIQQKLEDATILYLENEGVL